MNTQKLLADVKVGNTRSKWDLLLSKGASYLRAVRNLNYVFLDGYAKDTKDAVADWREVVVANMDILTANKKSMFERRPKEELAPLLFHLSFHQPAITWLQASDEAEIEAFLARSSLDELANLFTVSKEDFLRLACGLLLDSEVEEPERNPFEYDPPVITCSEPAPYPFPLIPTEKLVGMDQVDIEHLIKGRGLLLLAAEYDATENPVLKAALANVADDLVPLCGEEHCLEINRYQRVAGLLPKETLAYVARLIYHSTKKRPYDVLKAITENGTDVDVLAVGNLLDMTYRDAYNAIALH